MLARTAGVASSIPGVAWESRQGVAKRERPISRVPRWALHDYAVNLYSHATMTATLPLSTSHPSRAPERGLVATSATESRP